MGNEEIEPLCIDYGEKAGILGRRVVLLYLERYVDLETVVWCSLRENSR